MKELTLERMLQYFEYDAEIGELRHKQRSRDEFKSEATYSAHLNRVGKPAGYTTDKSYRRVVIDGKNHYAHRIIYMIANQEIVKFPEFEIDHINGDRLDNKICNLRKVTKSENQRNSGKRVDNKSGLAGVRWDKKNNKWHSRITLNGKDTHLGFFESFDDAVSARKNAEVKFGFLGPSRQSFRIKPQNFQQAGV